MKIKRAAAFVLIFVMLFTLPAFADETQAVNADNVVTEYYSNDLLEPLKPVTTTPVGTPPEIKAKAGILIEASTGQILFESNSHEKLAPASITKVMTLLLVMEAIDSKKIGLQDVVTTSEHAASMGGSQIWLEPGETMTVHELLKATVIGSANDATTALAEYLAGSEETFVSQMNERAKQLGLKDTNFKNCNGLDEDDHYTSAYDIAMMSKELLKHELITQYSTVWMDSLRGGETSLVNTNKLVRYYDGCTGLKTGTTDKAGHCLSASAQKNNLQLIAVVLGSTTGNDRFNSARKLLDYGFANWAMAKITIEEDELADVRVLGGVKQYVEIAEIESQNVLVPKGKEKQVTKEITIAKDVKAPVTEAQVLGKIIVKLGKEKIAEIPLYAAAEVKEMSFFVAVGRLLTALFAL